MAGRSRGCAAVSWERSAVHLSAGRGERERGPAGLSGRGPASRGEWSQAGDFGAQHLSFSGSDEIQLRRGAALAAQTLAANFGG